MNNYVDEAIEVPYVHNQEIQFSKWKDWDINYLHKLYKSNRHIEFRRTYSQTVRDS